MALSAQALCTVAELKTYLNIGDTHKSTLLEYLIEDASHRIIDYIGYDPHSDTYAAELYSGDGSHELVTKARPVTSVVEVGLWDGDTFADIDSSDLAQMQMRGWYVDGGDYVFERGRSNYAVTYVAGYSETECDKRFRATCLKIAAILEKESGRKGTLGIASQAFGDGSRTTYENPIEGMLDDLTVYRRLTP